MMTFAHNLLARHAELEQLLQDPSVIADRERLTLLTKEYTRLSPSVNVARELITVETKIAETERFLGEGRDAELRAIAQEEQNALEKRRRTLWQLLKDSTVKRDPLDEKNIIVEIRAGVGGEEAALFAATLFRMYARYAERQGWKTKLIAASRTGIGGLKEAIVEIAGSRVYRSLRFESGVHRVQRVPETEKSGRVHTSTATVVVLPEPEALDVELKPEDVKIEATTSSGHGGQSVKTTYSAVRLTHLPTGLVVTCQDERSQKQNKERALQVLRARLFALQEEKRRKETSDARRSQIGTGDRSEKIRTYNIPQDRVTDHRLKQNFSAVTDILDGNIERMVTALQNADDRS
ncbi:MAG: peptide chain release factor 1 [bacterium]